MACRVSKKLFYINLRTETRCRKPKLLGPEDLPDPKDEFRPMKDMNGKKYYLNPATGDDTYCRIDSSRPTCTNARPRVVSL